MIAWDTPEPVRHARQVVRELERVHAAMAAAEIATVDQTIADAIHAARKLTGPALRRARLVLKDADLKAAEQPGFDL